MVQKRAISFDMDGTITDLSFVDSVWLEGIPRLYAKKSGVSFEDARTYVKREYDKVGRERLEWYDLSYWTKKFDLSIYPQEILISFQSRIKLFPEVNEVVHVLRMNVVDIPASTYLLPDVTVVSSNTLTTLSSR